MLKKPDIFFVLIHGTYAKEATWPTDDNEKFRKTLCEELCDFNVKYDPQTWSGENSHQGRIKAGDDLAEYLKETYKENNAPLYLVGHSHGGSVISYALPTIYEKIKSLSGVINLATPHIHVENVEPKKIETKFKNLAISSSIVSALIFIISILRFMLTFTGDKLTKIQTTIFFVGTIMILVSSYLLVRYSLKNWMWNKFSEDDTATLLPLNHWFRNIHIPVLDVRVESDTVVTKFLHMVTRGGLWCQSAWSTINDKWKKVLYYFFFLIVLPLSLLSELTWFGKTLSTGYEFVARAMGLFVIFGAIFVLVSYILIIIPSFIANRWAFGAKSPYINRFLGIYTEDFPEWCKTKDNGIGKLRTGKVVSWNNIEQDVKDKLDKVEGITAMFSKRHSAVYESPKIIKCIAKWVKNSISSDTSSTPHTTV